MRSTLPLLLLFLLSLTATAQIETTHFHTAQLRLNEAWEQPPIVRLNSSDQLTLTFDELTHEVGWYTYALFHCNADGFDSQLSENEYLHGFNYQPVEEYQTSFNTLQPYTNYRLQLPNDQMQWRLSGNYRLEVYRDNDRSTPLLKAHFSVTEQLLPVRCEVKTITDIDYRSHHQQIALTLNSRNYEIRNPGAELKIRVRQNYRSDNEVWINTPLFHNANEIVYANNRALIFSAGNEFRRFEMTTHKYSGLGVEQVSYHAPYYHTTLELNRSRNQSTYRYDQDQDGRFIVRSIEADDSHTEADYHVTHFSLTSNQLLPAGTIYLFGELTGYQLDDRFRMEYSPERNRYESSILLKQGLYNYHYLFRPNGAKKGETRPFEGDFHETQNCYLIQIYHRPMGSRYDRLVSTTLAR